MARLAPKFAHRTEMAWLGLAIASLAFARAADTPAPAGEPESEAALIGIFYDLKQTPQHQPTGMDPTKYSQVVDEFLAKNWDESVLNRYYRASKPSFTTQIFIPLTNSDACAKAMGLDSKSVRPDLWVIHYKAQVSPPDSGTYRFVASGDDIIAIAVNGKTVLSSVGQDNGPGKFHWQPSEPNGPKAGSFLMVHGDWMDLKKDDVIDLDVIFGDEPGAVFDAFVMVQKKGATYAMDTTGHPILPIFQIAHYNTPVVNDVNMQPPFAIGFPIWQSLQ